MKISPSEAIDLLRKWMSERTPVRVLFSLPDSRAAINVSGFINGLSDDILVSDVLPTAERPAPNYLIFSAKLAEEFHYGEAKDFTNLPTETRAFYIEKFGPANLKILLSDGCSVSFFEAPVSRSP
jgi:hypothetical protein